jgi:hypothetical protein
MPSKTSVIPTNPPTPNKGSQVRTVVRTPVELVLVRLVSFVFGAIEVLIALRFALKLLAANKEAGFVQFVYNVTDFFMVPFDAIFKTRHASGSTLELSALVAIAVYALAGWGLVTLIRVLSPRLRTETVETVEKDSPAE